MYTQSTLRIHSNQSPITFIARRCPMLFVWAIGLLCALFTGCSDNGPVDPGLSTIGSGLVDQAPMRPGVGSTYIYKVTSSMTADTPHVSFDTMIVTRTGLAIGGKTDVVELGFRQYEDSYFYLYHCYEANGDLSHNLDEGKLYDKDDNVSWLPLPIASRRTTSHPSHWKSLKYPNAITRTAYEGSQRLTVGTASILSHHIVQTHFPDGQTTSLGIYRDFWYAPSIGNYTRIETFNGEGQRWDLVSYTLK